MSGTKGESIIGIISLSLLPNFSELLIELKNKYSLQDVVEVIRGEIYGRKQYGIDVRKN
ncbi:MAG: hypothetical protein GX457_15420 [Thermotogaceae bacterium]|nr:hypothetical protein [Thermotogaceae bacterium]